MSDIAKMFGEYTVAALMLAVAAFIAGFLLEMLLCRLFGSGCRGRASGSRRQGGERRHQPPADGSVEIYVGNLSYDLTEDRLRKEFEAFGKVNSARIITNKFNNKSKGFGFVHMPDRAEARAAVKALNDKDILGRKLKCNEAKNSI